jgi:hypothetical protein
MKEIREYVDKKIEEEEFKEWDQIDDLYDED